MPTISKRLQLHRQRLFLPLRHRTKTRRLSRNLLARDKMPARPSLILILYRNDRNETLTNGRHSTQIKQIVRSAGSCRRLLPVNSKLCSLLKMMKKFETKNCAFNSQMAHINAKLFDRSLGRSTHG